MKATPIEEEKGIVLQISGAVDLVTNNSLHDTLQSYAKSDVEYLILDMRDCAYIDSSGLSCLISNLHHFVDKNKKMVIAEPGKIQKTLKVTGLAEAFSIYETLDEARTALTS